MESSQIPTIIEEQTKYFKMQGYGILGHDTTCPNIIS